MKKCPGKYASRAKAAGLLSLLSLLLVFSCGRNARVIPKNRMAEIYADMFVADQWLNQNFLASRTADTTLVYEAVFEKYGYTSDDYRKSVDHYIQDPDRFARILRKSVLILEDRIAESKSELRKIKSLESMRPDTLIQFDFSKIWLFENGRPRLASRDSLEYFRDRMEYFILDLQPLAQSDKAKGILLQRDHDEVEYEQDSSRIRFHRIR